MLKIVFLLLAFILVFELNAQTNMNDYPNDSAIIYILKDINFNNFIGKRVSHFLRNDTIKFYRDWNFLETKPYSLAGLQLWYSDNIYINVYVYKTKYQKKENLKRKWVYELLKKEEISKIILFNKYQEIEVASVNQFKPKKK